MRISRVILAGLAASFLIFAGVYGCARKEIKSTSGMETQKPMEQAPAAPEKAAPPAREQAKVEAPPGPEGTAAAHRRG